MRYRLPQERIPSKGFGDGAMRPTRRERIPCEKVRQIGETRDVENRASAIKAQRSSVLEELHDGHVQAACECFYGVKGRIGLSPLDSAHVAPRKAAAVGQLLLGNRSRPPQGSNAISEFLSERNPHARESGLAYTDRPRTNRDIRASVSGSVFSTVASSRVCTERESDSASP